VKGIGALAIAAVIVTGGCGAPAATSAAAAHGRWQVVAFTPAEDTDVDGAILLDTQTGDSYVLCEYATAWCKLDRNE
jgi:hypothetical protein